MQILRDGEWLWSHPTGGNRYEYPSREDAYHMLSICYPDQLRAQRLGGNKVVRVQQIEENQNDNS